MRLLGKLARTDGDLPAARAEEVVRDTAHQLVAEWTLENPSPREHLQLLEAISSIDPVVTGQSEGVLTRIEDWRLLAFALETDLDTPAVRAAAVALAEQGYLSNVLGWIRHVGSTPTAHALRSAVLESGAVERLLADDAIETGEAEAIIGALGAEATELLVGLLADAPRRAVRRLVLLRLQTIGAAIVPVIETRLPTAEPRLARNLLVLMRDLRVRSPGVVQAALRALADDSPQVRAEAVRFLVEVPAACATAVARALRDTTPRIVRLALGAVIDAPADYATARVDAAVHDDIVAGCLRLAESEALDERTRAGAVLAAGALGGERVRDRLLALLVVRTRVLRRRTLADPTPPAIAALHVLRRDWHGDPAVAETLALAQREAHDPKWIAVPVLPTDEERP
ncbi:MAG: hypothetical protein MUF40_07160 [Gemmatimonadaceae bacterium]|nr:hypothetical protein [Gemmatimonadaceae bacterium]